MKDIIRIVKSLEDSGLLMEGVSKIIQNETYKKQDFIVCYQVQQVQFYQEILAGKGINRAGDGILRAGYGNKRQDYEKMNF